MRHGGALVRICSSPELAVAESDDDLIALDTALERLSNSAPAKAELIKLRCFFGLKIADLAVAGLTCGLLFCAGRAATSPKPLSVGASSQSWHYSVRP